MIVVERTAPLLTVQDRGRRGFFAAGVTRSGPLDAMSLDVANALVGNTPDAAALEGCLGGATFRCERAATVALTGANVLATRNGAPLESYIAYELAAGDTLAIERIVRGAIWYLAIRGGIDVPLVLGSRSTLLSAEMGGLGGATIRSGARLGTGDSLRATRPAERVPDELRAILSETPVPLCAAPRTDSLTDGEWDAFFEATWVVSHAVSRIGYRLEGPVLPTRLSADLPSEPACAGAMQLPPQGQPIVLMADHPTIGGYPVIGAVPTVGRDALAQRAPGTSVRFSRIDTSRALDQLRVRQRALSQWASRA
ncbi:MAG TPA: biotin-dependent carboxyltransferase family protein [Gemmatimonadaceae bacterium]|nr:biotin-dependent carboxyltransferase family protein [Gemmatimonadaceae bacterium]